MLLCLATTTVCCLQVFDNVADATRILREIKLLRLLKHADVVDIHHIMLPSDPRSFKDIYVVSDGPKQRILATLGVLTTASYFSLLSH